MLSMRIQAPQRRHRIATKRIGLHGLPISSGQAAGESLWSKGVLTSAVFRFLCATFALAALLLPISVSAHANHDASDEVGVQHQH
jgi:hypothetical protein